MSESTTVHLLRCLQRLEKNDATARGELLEFARRRLKLLADRMLFSFPQLRFREQSEDLLQEAMLRLWKSVEEVGPTTVPGFMGLAALQMRRALRDLARNHFGRHRENEPARTSADRRVGNHERNVETYFEDPQNAPDELMCWTEFHTAADQLTDPYRTTFDLLFYHGLSQREVAELMNMSERQVHRNWHLARIKLQRELGDSWPEL